MKSVLVTGASGFIGQHLLKPLLAEGYEVHGVFYEKRPDTVTDIIWHQTDLLDASNIDSLMSDLQPDCLLHTAWYAVPGKYWQSEENYLWLDASISLLRSFHRHGGKRVVMAGTCAEYDWKHGYCTENVTPLRSESPYAACKKALSDIFKVYCSKVGLSGSWGRIFFLYGTGEHPSRLVPSVVNSILRGEPVACTHGNQIRDFLYVEDVASAFVKLLGSSVEGPVNISSGQPVSIKNVIQEIAKSVNLESEINFGQMPVPENDPPLLVGNNKILRDDVGWKPEYSLADGISRSVSYWKKKGKP